MINMQPMNIHSKPKKKPLALTAWASGYKKIPFPRGITGTMKWSRHFLQRPQFF